MTEVEKKEFVIQWPDALLRVGLLILLWWLLNGDDWLSWWIGAPAIALATAVSLIVVPPVTWRVAPLSLFGFILYFLGKSLWSSVDVAIRVFFPRKRIPLQPAMLIYPLRLQGDFPIVLMANVISLLPGTLSVELKISPEDEPKRLKVHTLDERGSLWFLQSKRSRDSQLEQDASPVIADLRDLEARIAAIYGIDLGEPAP